MSNILTRMIETVRAKIAELRNTETRPTDYILGARNPRGIVYVGGGKYWYGMVAGIKLLRELGCALPVQIWYRGQCEAVYPDDVAGLGVTLIDIDAVSRNNNTWQLSRGLVCKGGWEAKLYALRYTGFNECLFLDADAYCIANPEPLFYLIESNSPYSFAYWQDLPSQNNSIKWANVYPEGESAGVLPVQGGQLLIDRVHAWKLIEFCNWMCQNSAYFFKHMYGDQDTWRVGLSAQLARGVRIDKARWVQDVAFSCAYEGEPFILHRCQGKIFAPCDIPAGNLKYSNPRYALPHEARVFTLAGELIAKHNPDAQTAFDAIYTKALWGRTARSGAGSTLREGQLYIDTVNRLIREYGITSVVDIGCGDCVLASRLEVAQYTGYDCSTEIVAHAKKHYPHLNIQHLDIITEFGRIGASDALLIKDVLHHWPNAEVNKFLDSLIQSKRFRYLFITNDCAQVSDSIDTHMGGYRALSFDKQPLNRLRVKTRVSVHHKEMGVIDLWAL